MSEPTNLSDWEFHFEGTIWGRLDNGERVRTTQVVARDPETNIIQTRSGSLYRLLNHGGKGYAPELMWNDRGWAVGEKKPIPRIERKETT